MIEVSNPLAANCAQDVRGENDNFIDTSVRATSSTSTSGKVFLPSRSGEPRFGPRPYYYPASRTGVLPSGSGEAVGSRSQTGERPTWAKGVAA
jgi:hypothetical protein